MDTKNYIIDRIKNSDVSIDPWKHLIVEDFLPQSLYEGIKKETSVYIEKMKMYKPENKGVRGYHVNVNMSMNVFPSSSEPYLTEYYEILLDRDIENIIKEKVFLNGYHKNIESVDMYGTFDVMTSGFTYDEVHPDHEAKMITMIHYLADECDDESLGTLLYSPKTDGSKQSVVDDIVLKTRYISNCVLFFAPCWKTGFMSNHSMMHHSKTTPFRKTLQNFWLREKSNWTRPQSGRILL